MLSIIPVIVTLASSISVHYLLRQDSSRVQPVNGLSRQSLRKSRLQRHMLLLTITSTMLFCATTLPISLRQIVTSFFIAAGITSGVNDSITQEAVLTILLTINYAVSSTLHLKYSQL